MFHYYQLYIVSVFVVFFFVVDFVAFFFVGLVLAFVVFAFVVFFVSSSTTRTFFKPSTPFSFFSLDYDLLFITYALPICSFARCFTCAPISPISNGLEYSIIAIMSVLFIKFFDVYNCRFVYGCVIVSFFIILVSICIDFVFFDNKDN